MSSAEQIKTSLSNLSAKEQYDVLMHLLQMKYVSTWREIQALTGEPNTSFPAMPDGWDMELLIEKIHLLDGIKSGLEQVSANESITHAEVVKRFESWRKR